MPNWCSNNYSFQGKSDEIKALKETFDLAKDLRAINDPDRLDKSVWFYDILSVFHTEYAIDKKFGRYNIREFYDSYELEGDDVLNVISQSAWDNTVPAWRIFLKEHFPSVELIFTSEECGMQIYKTNDPLVVGKYVLEINDVIDDCGCELYEYIIDEVDVIKNVNEFYESECINLECLEDVYDYLKNRGEKDEDMWWNIQQYEYSED